MKILAVGDFHGKIPRFLKKIIKKENPDVIISPGDFCSFVERKIWFKYCYGTDKELWEIIGKKKHNEYLRRNRLSGKKVIHYLKSLNIPLYTVTGNIDYTRNKDIGEARATKFRERPWTTNFLKKQKIPILDYSRKKFEDYTLIGYPRSSYPGILRKYILKGKRYGKFSKKRLLKDYKKQWKRVSKLFKGKKNIIFVSHNVPYRTKLDKITSKKADKRARGQHYGSYLAKELIKKYEPKLCICGHIHEHPGAVKIGRTLVVNPGAAMDKRCAVIDIRDKKIKVKFYK